MKHFLMLISLLVVLNSCNSNEFNITDLRASEIDFIKMPKKVQVAIKNYYTPIQSKNSSNEYNENKDLICLDDNIIQCEHRYIWNAIVSSWLDRQEIILNNKTIIIEQSIHNYNHPFVVYNGILYCRRNMNSFDFKDPSKDKYCMINLKMIKNEYQKN